MSQNETEVMAENSVKELNATDHLMVKWPISC